MKAKFGFKDENNGKTAHGTRLFSAAPLAFALYGGKWVAIGIIAALVLVLILAYLSQKRAKTEKQTPKIVLPAGEPTYRIRAKQAAAPEQESAPVMKKVTAAEAHRLLSDEVAAEMIERATTEEKAAREEATAGKEGSAASAANAPKEGYRAVRAEEATAPVRKKHVVNVDTLSKAFASGDVVDLEALKKKGLVPKNAKAIKILARGALDKVLTVRADDFSADAVKMIVLTGGKASRI